MIETVFALVLMYRNPMMSWNKVEAEFPTKELCERALPVYAQGALKYQTFVCIEQYPKRGRK